MNDIASPAAMNAPAIMNTPAVAIPTAAHAAIDTAGLAEKVTIRNLDFYYGDSKALPKVEDQIGKPLSPYAVTKYGEEAYAVRAVGSTLTYQLLPEVLPAI